MALLRDGRPRRRGSLFDGLRWRLLALVLLTVVPALLLIIHTAFEQRRQTTASIERSVQMALRPASNQYERMVEGASQLLIVLSRLPEVQRRDAAGCRRLFVDLLAKYPFYANMGLIGPDGWLVASAVSVSGPMYLGDRPYFRDAVATRGFAVGEFQVGRITHRAGVNFGHAVLGPNGELRGVAFLALDLAWLNELVERARLPAGSSLVLVDRAGTVLMHRPNGATWVGRPIADRPLFGAMRRGGKGMLETPGLDGVPRLFAFATLDGRPARPAAYMAIGIPTAVAYEPVDALLERNLTVFGLVAVLTVALAWVGGNVFVLREVEALVAATRRLSAGDFRARTGLARAPGELGQLARAFDEMVAELERLFAQRQRDAREIATRTAELRQAQEVDRLKSEFVNAISHDLRTPLTAMVGYVELMEDGLAGPVTDRQLAYLGQVRKGAKRLEGLVEDLLDFARLEAGTFKLRLEADDLAERARGIVESLRPQAEATGITLKADVPDAPLVLTFDPPRIERVLSNLLANALKFTPPGGEVSLRVTSEDGTARCEVRDNGLGIAAADLPRLFRKFSQLEAGVARGGTGLGLSIAKKIVEAHGGTIGVASVPGQGSRFWFTPPLAKVTIARPSESAPGVQNLTPLG